MTEFFPKKTHIHILVSLIDPVYGGGGGGGVNSNGGDGGGGFICGGGEVAKSVVHSNDLLDA